LSAYVLCKYCSHKAVIIIGVHVLFAKLARIAEHEKLQYEIKLPMQKWKTQIMVNNILSIIITIQCNEDKIATAKNHSCGYIYFLVIKQTLCIASTEQCTPSLSNYWQCVRNEERGWNKSLHIRHPHCHEWQQYLSVNMNATGLIWHCKQVANNKKTNLYNLSFVK